MNKYKQFWSKVFSKGFNRKTRKHEQFWSEVFSKGNTQEFKSWVQHNVNSRKEISNLVKELGAIAVLDLGCGVALDYEQYLEDGLQIDYHGVDITEAFVKEVKRKYPNLDIRLGNVEQIPHIDNSFDVVTCRHLLEHLRGLEKVIPEMRRVTKRYIIIVWFIPPGKHENKIKLVEWEGGKVFYENSYSVDYVTETITKNKLSILDKRTIGKDEVWILKKENNTEITRQEVAEEKHLSTPAKNDKKYIWASITESAVNNGNYLIEYCLKRILRLPKPNLVVDVFQSEFPHNLDDYQFILNPGSTTLYPDSKVAFQKFIPGKTPIICFGASVWYRGIGGKIDDEKQLIQVAKKMKQPVGCRDPFTCDLLQRNGIEAEFIGCPTLFCQGESVSGDYIVFSFGRDNISKQIRLLRHLSETQNVKVLIHEAKEERYCQDLKVEIIKDLHQFLGVYYGAKYIITGRLHGALPGISAHKPVFYFKEVPEFDSRLTLLSYLGLPIQTIDEVYSIDTSALQYDFNRVMDLKRSFFSYVKKFKEDFDL